MTAPEKFVLRLLDADGGLLGWTVVWALPRPQRNASCAFYPTDDTFVPIERDGTVMSMSVHWCDLDIARSVNLEPVRAVLGQRYKFSWLQPVWVVSGMANVPLPTTTEVQSVTIGVPVGGLASAAGSD